MAVAGELKFVITTDDKGSVIKIDNITGAVGGLENKSKKAGDVYSRMLKKIIAGGTILMVARKAFSLISDSISLASSAMEEHSKLNTVFSNITAETSMAVEELTDSYGLSTLSAEKMLGATGDLLTGLGANQKVALELSKQTQKHAVDLASFTNYAGDAAGASEAITKALLGEREMMKGLGISILETDLSQRLLEKGQQNLSGSALKTAKAQATLALIMEQSKNAMGDFSRTQDSFANQSRQLDATIVDLKVDIGKTFVDLLLPFLKDFSSWIKDNKESILAFFKGLADVIKGLSIVFDEASTFGAKFMTAISDLGQKQAEVSEVVKQAAAKWTVVEDEYGNIVIVSTKLEETTKKLSETTKKVTSDIVKQKKPLTDVEKIMKKYGVSTQSATAILQKQKPEIEEIGKLQKTLGVSLEEATKVYKILNNLESDRKNNLNDTSKPLSDIIENNIDLDESVQEIIDAMGEEKRRIEELSDVVDGGSESFAELAGTVRETADEMANSVEKSTLLDNILNKISKIEMSKYFEGISMALDVLGDAMGENNEVFDNFKNISKSLASGNYLGAVAAAIQHVTYVLGPAGLTGGAELATEALSNLGVTSQEAIGELTNLLEKYVEANSLFSSIDDPEEYWENFAKYAEDAAKKVAEDTAEYYEKAFDAAPALADYLKVSATSQTEFNDQVNITLGLFANMMKSGASITEVMSTMGDSFDALIASQEANKWAADDTFKALSEFRTLIKNNEELVKSVEGFNAVLQMTAELGKMDQDQFESYGRSTVAQFDKLRNAGFSQNQSLLMMAPSLKILSDQAEEYGLKLDANTQSLIDQAKQQGMFDEMADPLDTIADILKTIGEALGADMSEFQKLDSTINSAAENSSNDIQQIDMEMVKLGENTTNTAKTMTGDINAFAEMSADSMKGFAGESVGAMTMLAEGSVNAMTTLSDGTNNAANSMKSGFDDASKKSLDSIRNFVNAANKELGKLGQNNGFPQPPLNPPQRNIPKFATGGGGIVPPGFNNDDFLIGVSSGEEFQVTPAGGNINNSRTVGDVNMTVVVQASSGDSVDTLTNKLIQAVRVNGQNIVGELEKAGL